jgi:hypothetical protein
MTRLATRTWNGPWYFDGVATAAMLLGSVKLAARSLTGVQTSAVTVFHRQFR